MNTFVRSVEGLRLKKGQIGEKLSYFLTFTTAEYMVHQVYRIFQHVEVVTLVK